MKPRFTFHFSGLFRALAIGAGLFTTTLISTAQDARYFRVAGPVATTITEFRPDGTLVWANAPTNATFTVQTATSLGGGSNWVDYVQIPATNGVNTNRVMDFHPPSGMALIPAGSFTMGDNLDGYTSAQPVHTVYVSAFYMDRYEVTKALWDSVYSWAITNGYGLSNAGSGKAANHPVLTIDWYDCVKWCNARSEMEGRTPAYYTTSAQTTVYRTGQLTMQNDWVKWGSGYRLPTEAEWEKAARGGASGQRFPWGNTITHNQANYKSSADDAYDISLTRGYHPTFATGAYPYTSPAGYFGANGYGLYDMAGNVWEWCWDWYSSSYYSSSPASDPGGSASGSYRVNRGGSWLDYAFICRSALRGISDPTSRNGIVGFRSVLPPGQ